MPGMRLSSKRGLSDRYACKRHGSLTSARARRARTRGRGCGRDSRRCAGAELAGVWKNFDERTSLLEYHAVSDAPRWLALGTVEDIFALAARARSLHRDRSGLHERGRFIASRPERGAEHE